MNPTSTFKHPDTAIAVYKRKQIKHLKQTSETLIKTSKKAFENHCKHMQHQDETLTKHTYKTPKNT
jgi:hypothetical protein